MRPATDEDLDDLKELLTDLVERVTELRAPPPQRSQYGGGTSEYGPGVLITLNSNERALAVDLWLYSQGIIVQGPRTVRFYEDTATVYVDPSGFVIEGGIKIDGRGIRCRHTNGGDIGLSCSLAPDHEGDHVDRTRGTTWPR